MLVHEREQSAQLNWMAILSYTGCVAISLGGGGGGFRILERLVR
jgi:hypothetical protein